MDKKSLLQILIGLLAAIIVFCAVYIPYNNCKSSNSSSKRPTSSFRPVESSGEWDSAYGDGSIFGSDSWN